ncbi:MAG: Hsp20/alpha crystallin family protein [Syntrophaceae bacterium]|nr:Hsp20/alpha crystallin family protein [Syntrophaceae bacterium]
MQLWRTGGLRRGDLEMLRRLDDMFNMMNNVRGQSPRTFWTESRLFPLMNVKEDPDSFVVLTEIPGMKIEDLELKIEGGTLTLKGERKAEELPPGASYHRREIATGPFQRSLTLPAKIDSEDVTATYRNGILKVTLAKEKRAVPKQIKISSE